MKAFSKFPILALLCFTALGTTFSNAALAGQTTTQGADAEPGSSIGVTFPPGSGLANIIAAIKSNPALAAALSDALTLAASDVGIGGDVASAEDGLLKLSDDSASIIARAINANGASNANGAGNASVINRGLQQALAQQISNELSNAGVSMDVTTLAAALTGIVLSPENLPLAIAEMNALIRAASSEELRALASSPSIMAIRQILMAGNAAL